MPAWHEQDEFWNELFGLLFDDARIAAAAEEVDGASKLLQLKPGASVLDMCCGPGRHSLELARRGFRVTGVDRTASYLANARAKAAEQNLDVEFVQEDIRKFERVEAFDGVINLYTSFGYFETRQEDLQALRNLRSCLKPGGRLVMEMMGKEVLARIYTPKDWQELPDGALFLAERQMRDGWEMNDNRWIWIRGADRKEFRFSHRVYSGTELADLLAQAGFTPLTTYGKLDGRPYDSAAEKLVAVARK